jgi:amino acid permease
LLFKAFIGSGILFLPKAFSNGGLAFSVAVIWLMGCISLYCFLLLLDCKNFVAGSYGDIGEATYGPWMRRIVLFSIAISQVTQGHRRYSPLSFSLLVFFSFSWALSVVERSSLCKT